MKKMMGCIMCLLLIGTNNSEVMCGLRQNEECSSEKNAADKEAIRGCSAKDANVGSRSQTWTSLWTLMMSSELSKRVKHQCMLNVWMPKDVDCRRNDCVIQTPSNSITLPSRSVIQGALLREEELQKKNESANSLFWWRERVEEN